MLGLAECLYMVIDNVYGAFWLCLLCFIAEGRGRGERVLYTLYSLPSWRGGGGWGDEGEGG